MFEFHTIYFIIILVYGLWLLGIYLENDILAVLSSLFMFPLSIFLVENGIDSFYGDNMLLITFSAITFALAVVTSFQAAYNMYAD